MSIQGPEAFIEDRGMHLFVLSKTAKPRRL